MGRPKEYKLVLQAVLLNWESDTTNKIKAPIWTRWRACANFSSRSCAWFPAGADVAVSNEFLVAQYKLKTCVYVEVFEKPHVC